MLKAEMKKAWEQQWNETHEVYNYCNRMIEFHKKYSIMCAEKEDYEMANYHRGAIYELKEIRDRLDKILYKEI